MSNRLISETSPYLLQHADNPVDWYPWGDEAFEKARSQDKPIFLSVGYSACHWCHVMERESFEDEATAALLNERFVSVKVDREERPDVDAIYMAAVQTLTGRGGWPMSVFLTPDAVPFYGGTYFPGTARDGVPSFTAVLAEISMLWETKRDRIVEAGAKLKGEMERTLAREVRDRDRRLEPDTLETALQGLSRSFDRNNGGWGGAPKFPQPAVVEFLLRRHHATGEARLLEMATRTLDAMMRGGIYDQLGGGFHRYATDAIWLVPHFEKMLYDNAQLARLYLHAWQVTGTPAYRRVATETLDYVVREMLDPDGGFYSAQDADSEGEEGRFFVWTPSEIRAAFMDWTAEADGDAELFMSAYGVSAGGNFDGASILFVARTAAELASDAGLLAPQVEARLASARRALLSARGARVRPGLDDKVLASWNGLMLAAFAEAARVFDRDDYRAVAERNADFLLSQMRMAEGRMLRSWKGGRARLNGYLDDYAHVADGLLGLYEATFDERWFAAARELADWIIAHFSDPSGGFFDTSDDHETLIVRPKGLYDGVVPSGGAMAAQVLFRLAHLTGEVRYSEAAEAAVAQAQPTMAQTPLGFANWLADLDFALAPPQDVAIVGDDPGPLLAAVRARYRPDLVVAVGPARQVPAVALLEGRDPIGRQATAYVCRRSTCERPVTDPAELDRLLV